MEYNNKYIKIYPSKLSGKVFVPTSKSISHRALFISSLKETTREITLHDMYLSDDVIQTIKVLEILGAQFDLVKKNRDSYYDVKVVKKIDFGTDINDYCFNISYSATTLRFLIPFLNLFFKDKEFSIKINCHQSLLNRPLDSFNPIDSFIIEKEDNSLNIKYIKPIYFENLVIDGSISSQFISGLLLTLPILRKNISFKTVNLESIDYVIMTIEILKIFGYVIEVNKIENYFIFSYKGNIDMKISDYYIEGDYTQASVFLIYNKLVNGNIEVLNLSDQSIQGDKRINDYLSNLHDDISFDITNSPDLAIMLACLLTKYGGYIDNVKRLSYKESDRLQAIVEEFEKLNIKTIISDNRLYIEKTKIIGDVMLSSHNDHRVFMGLVILGLISDYPIIIDDYNCINKSYPTFLNDLRTLKAKFEFVEERSEK